MNPNTVLKKNPGIDSISVVTHIYEVFNSLLISSSLGLPALFV